MTVPRTSPSSVLFSSYNLLNLFADGATGGAHYDAVTSVIRSLDTDVLAVQEVLAGDLETAARHLRRLARDTGMRCEVPSVDATHAAICFGGHGSHVGLMWRDGIDPLPGSLHCLGGTDFWHGLAMLTLDVGGTLVRHASFHATPFSRPLRADQNARLVAAITRPPGGPPALVGADWNTGCADRILRDGTWQLYEPDDPFASVEWFADMVYQCEWEYDEQGCRRHWLDRQAADVLWAGGLHDVAAVLNAPRRTTTGYHSDDGYAAHGIRRRIDAVRVTAQLIPALRGHEVTDSELTRSASDHLPVTAEYLPSALDA